MRSDTDSVGKFLTQFAESWAANDGAVLGDLFTEDGSLINPFGQRVDGRAAIAAMYDDYFNGMLAGTTTTVAVESVRAIDDGHALADAEQTITAADGTVVLVAHLTALLRRRGEEWRFADSRPYAFGQLPR
jgi:uncharacterized protein (TIGR02246 family)